MEVEDSWFYSFFLTAFQNTQSHYIAFCRQTFSSPCRLFLHLHARLASLPGTLSDLQRLWHKRLIRLSFLRHDGVLSLSVIFYRLTRNVCFKAWRRIEMYTAKTDYPGNFSIYLSLLTAKKILIHQKIIVFHKNNFSKQFCRRIPLSKYLVIVWWNFWSHDINFLDRRWLYK